MITLCVLCYGDHVELAQRCLGSIRRGLTHAPAGVVTEIRIGQNACSAELQAFVKLWSEEVTATFGQPVRVYTPDTNVGKYPLMRRMFYDTPPLDQWVMWFDDDSYFQDDLRVSWWLSLQKAMADADMLGQLWLMPMAGNQWEWIQQQHWYNKTLGKPTKLAKGELAFEFCQGAWWVMRTEMIRRLGWPFPELHHNGGDSMLGEALRHVGGRMRRFTSKQKGHVRINADVRGRDSASKRRGIHEPRIGSDYVAGQVSDLSHHMFTCTRRDYVHD
jgi:hypothetical protein